LSTEIKLLIKEFSENKEIIVCFRSKKGNIGGGDFLMEIGKYYDLDHIKKLVKHTEIQIGQLLKRRKL